MFIYLTLYKIKELSYRSYVVANSEAEALEKIAKRNIGEGLIDAQPLPFNKEDLINIVDLFNNKRLDHCIHALTFICYVLMKSNLIDVDYCLSDEGVLHQLIHYQHGIYLGIYEDLLKSLFDTQQLFDSISH